MVIPSPVALNFTEFEASALLQHMVLWLVGSVE